MGYIINNYAPQIFIFFAIAYAIGIPLIRYLIKQEEREEAEAKTPEQKRYDMFKEAHAELMADCRAKGWIKE